MLQCSYRGMEDNNIDPNEYGIDYNGPVSDNNDTTVVIDKPRNILNHDQKILLQSRISRQRRIRINVYNKTVQVVAIILNSFKSLI